AQLMDFVEANLSTDIALGDLARLTHLSENHLIRAFRAATGKTPYQYVLHRRLEMAAIMLRRPNCSVRDAASTVGFRSQSHFSSTFRSKFGLTPNQFRQHCLRSVR